MAIQDVIATVVSEVAKNPEMLSSLLEHPYSTIGNLTGNENVSKEEASQVVTAASSMASGESFDFANLASMAASLLSQNNNSVHELASALLGSGSAQGIDISNGISSAVMDNLLGSLSKNTIPGVDLTDGFGLDDVMGLANLFLGKK